jgi:CRISPR/Cas system-associated endonuclease Cas1
MKWKAFLVSAINGICLLSGVGVSTGVIGLCLGYGIQVGMHLAGAK